MLTLADFFVLGLVLAAAAGALFWMRHRKKAGKGCCGDCGRCAGNCSSRPPKH